MADSFQIESVRKLSREQLRTKINELLASLETATPEERELISYKADIYIHELDRKRDYWSLVSTRDLLLEVIVIALIGWEIWLSYCADKQQHTNFVAQQQVLTQLVTSSGNTVTAVSDLKQVTGDMKGIVQRELKQVERTANASERSAIAAEASSKTAVDALHTSERAYVAGNVDLKSPPKAGEFLHFTSAAYNTGRTPALSVMIVSYGGYIPKNASEEDAQKFIKATMTLDRPPSVTDIAPGAAGAVSQSWDGRALLDELVVKSLESGELKTMIFEEISYKDVFGVQHSTKVCVFYDMNLKKASLCSTFNSSN